MIKKKIKLYYKALIQLFFKCIYGKIFVPKTIDNLLKKEKINNSLFKSYYNKSYNIYKINNARIFTDNNENVAIIKDNLILPFVSFQQVNGDLRNIKHNTVVRIGTPSFIKKIKGKVFNLCQGDSGNNYFHFMFDILPKIYLFKSQIDLKNINYFYLSDPKKWQINILKLIGIQKKKILSSKIYNHIMVDEIYAVDHPWYHKGLIQYNLEKIPEWIINYNRKFFLKNYGKFQNKRIFLDRSLSKFNHCQIENKNDIINLITKKNFEIHRPEYISIKKQLKLFRNSSIVIGAHGAAFTNIIFCKPKTKIVEIIPSDHPNKKCKRISKVLNFKYYRIKTKPNNKDKNFPFKISLNKENLKSIERIINL